MTAPGNDGTARGAGLKSARSLAHYAHAGLDEGRGRLDVSAVSFGEDDAVIWMRVREYLVDAAAGTVEQEIVDADICITPAEARDVAASLLLAADRAEHRI